MRLLWFRQRITVSYRMQRPKIEASDKSDEPEAVPKPAMVENLATV